jgi:predicted metal-dependent hydrolase
VFPTYSYVPGRFPHPHRNPDGHGLEGPPGDLPAPDTDRWRDASGYLRGIALFNHGYYWEAHEVWEAVWIACGRTGRDADFFKGLIKLAAAGVKAREGRADGVRRHAERAAQLLQAVSASRTPRQRLFGLNLPQLIDCAQDLAARAALVVNASDQPVVVVMPFQLLPSDESADP